MAYVAGPLLGSEDGGLMSGSRERVREANPHEKAIIGRSLTGLDGQRLCTKAYRSRSESQFADMER